MQDGLPSRSTAGSFARRSLFRSAAASSSSRARVSLFRRCEGDRAEPPAVADASGSARTVADTSNSRRVALFRRMAADQQSKPYSESLTKSLIEEVAAAFTLHTEAAQPCPSVLSGRRKRPHYNNSGRAFQASILRAQKKGAADKEAERRGSSARIESLLQRMPLLSPGLLQTADSCQVGGDGTSAPFCIAAEGGPRRHFEKSLWRRTAPCTDT